MISIKSRQCDLSAKSPRTSIAIGVFLLWQSLYTYGTL